MTRQSTAVSAANSRAAETQDTTLDARAAYQQRITETLKGREYEAALRLVLDASSEQLDSAAKLAWYKQICADAIGRYTQTKQYPDSWDWMLIGEAAGLEFSPEKTVHPILKNVWRTLPVESLQDVNALGVWFDNMDGRALPDRAALVEKKIATDCRTSPGCVCRSDQNASSRRVAYTRES
jgi:hypothetical protein